MPRAHSKYVQRFEGHAALISAAVFVCCLAIGIAGMFALPSGNALSVPAAIAIAGVFFGGRRISLAAGAAAAAAAIIVGMPPVAVIIATAGVTANGLTGGWLLRVLQLDPLFRRRYDVGCMLLIAILSGFIFALASRTLSISLGVSAPGSFEQLVIQGFVAQMIVTTFLLRWVAKPMFRRTAREAAETVAAFLALSSITATVFIARAPDVLGISPAYYELPVLAWIALRLRPRFVTLALMIMFAIALGYELLHGSLIPFDILLWFVMSASGFLFIAAQEEERRVYKNSAQLRMESLENAVARAESDSKAKSDFIAVLSHELRNPLAALASSLEVLRLDADRPDEENAALSQMTDHVMTVRRMLDDLLDVSRISEGKITIENGRFDLGETLDRAIKTTEHYRAELHQQLRYAAPKGPLPFTGDTLRIQQVFTNLLANASKYSDSGDTIRVQVHADDAWIIIRIEDEGVGIAPEMLEHIFEPFQQIEQGARTSKGLGIGLWLVRQLTELHGGTVTAESGGTGRGSAFTVRLPRPR